MFCFILLWYFNVKNLAWKKIFFVFLKTLRVPISHMTPITYFFLYIFWKLTIWAIRKCINCNPSWKFYRQKTWRSKKFLKTPKKRFLTHSSRKTPMTYILYDIIRLSSMRPICRYIIWTILKYFWFWVFSGSGIGTGPDGFFFLF